MSSFSEIQHVETDVLIIGGGVAGMMAAVGCIRSGVKPILMTKATFPSGSSSMARGGYSAAVARSDSPEFYYEDAIAASDGLCNRRLMKIMSSEVIERTYELDEWGLGLVKTDDGNFHQKNSGSHRMPRLLHCGKLMGKPLMKSLAKKLKEWEVPTLQHVIFVDFIKEAGRVTGAWGFYYRDARPVVVHAKSTILATGGAPQLHEINDSPPYVSGDGYAMALRAGAKLIDMEFIDYQLLTAAPLKIRGYPPHTSGFIHAGAYLLNKDKERFMWNYDPENGERSSRAMINRAVGMEIFKGRGTENYGIYLDTSHVIDKVNNGATSDVIRVFKNSGVDLSKDPMEVASGPHTYLGGVLIDEWGRTNIQGLYAGGEAAGGIHGANRLGGAALADSYVFGLRSGIGAACEIQGLDNPDPDRGNWKEGIEILKEKMSINKGPDDKEVRKKVQTVAVSLIGQIRHGDKLLKALDELKDLQEENRGCVVKGDTDKKKFDSLRRIQETDNLIEVSKMLSESALERKESRGGHFRNDCPDIDKEWECSLVVFQDQGKIAVKRREIVQEDEAGIEPENQPGTASVV
jgi:fumarate reductase (CoM/CoB) subunit A